MVSGVSTQTDTAVVKQVGTTTEGETGLRTLVMIGDRGAGGGESQMGEGVREGSVTGWL